MFFCGRPVLTVTRFFMLFLLSSSVQATALGIGSAFFDLPSLDIQGDVTIADPMLEASIDLFDKNEPNSLFNTGDHRLFESISTANTFGAVGNDGSGVIEVTSSSTVIDAGESTSALSGISILVPFINESDGDVNVAVDYGIFVSASSDALDEFSFAAAQVVFALLNENFNEIFYFEDEIFQEAIQLGDSQFALESFSMSLLDLSEGAYFVALSAFSSSITEIAVATADIPEPGILLLFILGVFILLSVQSARYFR